MADILQHRKGTRAGNDLLTGALAELSIDVDSKALRVHDGAKAGGYELGMAQANGMADLRTHMPAIGARRYLTRHTTEGDGGHGIFRAVIGAVVGTYVDNNGTTIVPTGGDGSAAWLREDIDYVTPRMFGAAGNGANDDSVAIQTALDSVPNGKALTFTDGTYKISGTLHITRNISIAGTSARNVIIRGDNLPASSPIFDIAITSNNGLLDIRNWSFENISVEQNLGGSDCIKISGGFTLITSAIRNCNLHAGALGKSLNVLNMNFSHSIFELNTCSSPIYLACADANIFRKNNVFNGRGAGFTIDVAYGVKNNVFTDNTIVSRDGALHIVNGSAIRFINNQVEQFQAFGVNQSYRKASVRIEGAASPSTNCIIENNNFGGGTNVDYSIYCENAQHCNIDNNMFVATKLGEVFCSSLTKYITWGEHNDVISTLSNPRTNKLSKAVIANRSWNNINIPLQLTGVNGWTCPSFIRDGNGFIRFLGLFNSGIILPGTLITTLSSLDVFSAVGAITFMLTTDSTGAAGSIKVVGTNGQLIVGNLTSNALVLASGYQSFTATSDY